MGCSMHHHFYYCGNVPGFIWASSGWRNELKGNSRVQSVATVFNSWIWGLNLDQFCYCKSQTNSTSKSKFLMEQFWSASCCACVEPVLIQTYLLIYFWKKVWRIYSSLPHVCFLVSTPWSRVLIMKSVKPFPKCLFWPTSTDTGKRTRLTFGKWVLELQQVPCGAAAWLFITACPNWLCPLVFPLLCLETGDEGPWLYEWS